jgi:hypothetical protein
VSAASPPSNNVASHSDHHHTGINVPAVEPCSNCKRWKRECTFNWLLSARTEPCRKKKKTSHNDQQGGLDKETTTEGGGDGRNGGDDAANPSLPPDSNPTFPPQPQLNNLNEQSFAPESNDPFSALSAWADQLVFSDLSGVNAAVNVPWYGEPQLVTPPPTNEGLCSKSLMFNHLDEMFSFPDSSALASKVNTVTSPLSPFAQGNWCRSEQRDSSSYSEMPDLSNLNGIPPHTSGRDNRRSERTSTSQPTQLSFSSQRFVDDFFRIETARNLLRVYHDSIENALTCWLTERNCPYTIVVAPKRQGYGSFRSKVTTSIDGEWGPQWSNRMCARVCRLDRAYSSVRGRDLTMKEERIASRALHAAIMAFASQWSPESIAKVGVPGHCPSGYDGKTPFTSRNFQRKDFERAVSERLWNEAFHVLHEAAGIESFRVVFAHLIFSLTQRPLNGEKQARSSMETPSSLPTDNLPQKIQGLVELRELFDRDPAPLFLEAAIRQMFSCRYKLTRFQRQGDHKSGSLSTEDHETFNMLFWLGVMFDTLTAAIYQRPLVVSDEDSDIRCAVVPRSQPLQAAIKLEDRIDLDGWDFERESNDPRGRAQHVWGDLFIHEEAAVAVAEGQLAGKNITRWPCSYEEAAETLSDSAPAKVLLYRRVTRLQTLVYRGAGPEQLEEAIRDTLRVYHCWNRTYGLFMLDCVAHHDDLPPRIQSWYVLLAGHWHLGAFLLADTIESIDKARMGLEVNRECRRAANLVSELKKENAIAVSRLAQSSLRRDSSLRGGVEFHDAVKKDGAFLTEPWTAVLINSFARAGYILLDRVITPQSETCSDEQEKIHFARRYSASTSSSTGTLTFEKDAIQQCRFCIEALWALAKKCDMASVAARSLSNSFEETMIRLHGMSQFIF